MERFNGKILRAWKDVINYEGLYQVSTDGKVRSLDRYVATRGGAKALRKGKEIKLRKNSDGYYMVNLSNRTYSVHRLVAQAFIPNPDNKQCIDHINTIRDDNRVSNLKWVTHKENMNNPLSRKHMSEAQIGKTGKKGKIVSEETKQKISEANKGENHPRAKAVYCYELDEIRLTAKEWSRELDINATNISLCCKGKRKTCGGYTFRYATEEEKLSRG